VAGHEFTQGGARQVSRRSLGRTRGAGATRGTVLIALAANAVIAVTKLAGGLISGSTALLAEAAHSLADTANQVFLLTSIALSRREPSEEHPFGYGQQRFLWAFVAAVSTFVAGAVFACGFGILEIVRGGESDSGFAAAWITLAIAFAAEGTSWVRALRQTRREARRSGIPLLRHVRESRDPSVKLVLFEDSAALVGIALAAGGIGLHQLTGKAVWDAGASILIGLLLIAVAGWMAHDTGRLLGGAAATRRERAAIEEELERHPLVVDVVELLTLVLAPNALLVAARVDLEDGLTGADVERMSSELDDQIRERVPDVTEVFIDPTPGRSPAAVGQTSRTE
jgi:cation diffusion facilitator family transporter